MLGYFIGLAVIVLMIFLLGKFLTRTRKPTRQSAEDTMWQLVDSRYEELPKRPKGWAKEKNAQGIYLDRMPVIRDTQAEMYWDEQSQHTGTHLTKVASMPSGFFPIYTTVHNTEEHYLTTLYISFHTAGTQFFLDLASMDTEFRLDEDNIFRCLFEDGTLLAFALQSALGVVNGWHYTSIPLTEEQFAIFQNKKLDKWSIEKTSELMCAVGALNFEIRQFIYKPELQYTIQVMAQTIQQQLH